VWSATAKAIVALGVGIYLVGLVLTLVGLACGTTPAAAPASHAESAAALRWRLPNVPPG
jgi:hypothetical protein